MYSCFLARAFKNRQINLVFAKLVSFKALSLKCSNWLKSLPVSEALVNLV
jgi:hypothetical protein